MQLSDDYARAEFLRDRLIPKAILFFTGEALDDDDDGQEGGFTGEEDEDDDENGDGGDDNFNPQEQVRMTWCNRQCLNCLQLTAAHEIKAARVQKPVNLPRTH